MRTMILKKPCGLINHSLARHLEMALRTFQHFIPRENVIIYCLALRNIAMKCISYLTLCLPLRLHFFACASRLTPAEHGNYDDVDKHSPAISVPT
jgi:hypothetical protein